MGLSKELRLPIPDSRLTVRSKLMTHAGRNSAPPGPRGLWAALAFRISISRGGSGHGSSAGHGRRTCRPRGQDGEHALVKACLYLRILAVAVGGARRRSSDRGKGLVDRLGIPAGLGDVTARRPEAHGSRAGPALSGPAPRVAGDCVPAGAGRPRSLGGPGPHGGSQVVLQGPPGEEAGCLGSAVAG